LNIISTLKKSVMFRELCEEDLKKIAAISKYKNLSKGEILFSEGVKARGFFLVVSGKIRVFKTSMSGKEQTLHIIYPFETFAEASMFSGESFPASAEALEESVLLFVKKERFISLIGESPRLSIGIIASFSRLLRQFNTLVEELSLKDVPARLAKYLLELPEQQVLADGNTVAELSITKTHLASHMGTTIETVSRSFRKLKDRNIIKLDRSQIIILEKEVLEKIALGNFKF